MSLTSALKSAADRHDTTDKLDKLVGPRGLYRNLHAAKNGVWAWYLLDQAVTNQTWDQLPGDEREALIRAVKLRYGALIGKRIHLRGLPVPVDASTWARTYHAAHRRRLPDVPGAETFAEHLANQQRFIKDQQLTEQAIYLGVRLTSRRMNGKKLPLLFGYGTRRELAAQEDLRKELDRITGDVALTGFNARPVSSRELGALMQASRAIGVPTDNRAFAGAGDYWTQADVDAITDAVTYAQEPYDQHLTVSTMRSGRRTEVKVALATFGQMEERRWLSPSFVPWLAFTARGNHPMQFSAILDVHHPAKIAPVMRLKKLVAVDQAAHYNEVGEDAPPAVSRKIRAAIDVEDDVATGAGKDRARLSGAWRLAAWVPVNTETTDLDEARRTAERKLSLVMDEIIDTYAEKQSISVAWPAGQHALYAEFFPGAGRATQGGYTRWMPSGYAATAVPNAAGRVGDSVGGYIGQVVDVSRQAVFFEPTWGPQNDFSGLIPVIGAVGSGKSTFAGGLAYDHVRGGDQCIIDDPSELLARLVGHSALRPYARHLDLMGSKPGVFNPYRLVLDPRREDHPDQERYEQAMASARQERQSTIIDTFSDLLPPGMFDGRFGADILAVLEESVTEVEAHLEQNPWRVVDWLAEHGQEAGAAVARALRASAQLPGGSLIFPNPVADTRDVTPSMDAVLTVQTMKGITPPPAGTPRREWSREERMAVPLLRLSARLGARAALERKNPTLLITDELGQVTAEGSQSSYRSYLTRLAVDTRKNNTAVVILGQNPTHLTTISSEIDNLVGAAFIGKLKSRKSATSAVELMGLPAGAGYEGMFLDLPEGRGAARQFVIRDWHGRVATFQADVNHRTELRHVLDTTPTARTAHVEDAA